MLEARRSHRRVDSLKTVEPAGRDNSKARGNKGKEERKRKEEQDSELVTTESKPEEAGIKKQRSGGKPRWLIRLCRIYFS